MDLLLGTNNLHKKEEIQSIFEKYLGNKYNILIPSDISKSKIDVIEDGKTLEENAFKKAQEYYNIFKIPCFADDTGLEIKALNGLPGVNSARFSGEHGNDAANRKKVIKLLKESGNYDWSAQFRTVICFYKNQTIKYIEGICKGKIIAEERGKNGFGYDSIFIPDGYDITFAEMELSMKNRISHRFNAILKFIDFLKNSKLFD